MLSAPRAIAFVIASIAAGSGTAACGAGAPPDDHAPLFGGAGGVYFLAGPGALDVEVIKRDRNVRDTPTELRAILFGPDRAVLAEARIPDDGRPRGKGIGPAQTARLSARVEHRGIFGLMITVSGDRYGDQALWGFRSNCPRYVIETARGHRDERHQEPIVIFSPDRAATVCFAPRTREFAIELQHKGQGGGAELRDASDMAVASMPVAAGRTSGRIGAGAPRGTAPWRLIVPPGETVVHIDGVTRWDDRDSAPDMALWTPDPASWFALPEVHQLLTPYRRLICHPPDAPGQVTFRAHNGASRTRTIALAVEFPDAPWPAKLSKDSLVLAPGKTAEVSLAFVAPPHGASRSCHVRATPADDRSLSTFAALTVRAGEPAARKPINLPLTLRPFEHENEQFGHLPDYPCESEVYFDMQNRPCALAGGRLATTCADGWTNLPISAAADAAAPRQAFAPIGSKIAFDAANNLYVLASSGSRRALLRSRDGGQTFTAWDLPRGRLPNASFDIEQFSGHNVPDGPPPIARYTLTATDPKLFWRRVHDVELLLPLAEGDRIVFAPPVLISTQGIGLAMHSGIPATLASRAGRTHICWGEATDPAAKAPGVPAFVASFDRESGRLGPPALIGYGAPPNDIHNTPTLTMDASATLHGIGGTHGAPFPYGASLKPNDAAGGWTPPSTTGQDLPQTYIGMVCGPDGTLHTTFRLWQRGKEPFPLSSYATLAYQRKRPGQDWEPPKVLVVPPLSEYSVFYHRLTVDRKGRLFLSYDYWSTFWFYRNDHPGRRRALMMSPDGGNTWKLAQGPDLSPTDIPRPTRRQ